MISSILNHHLPVIYWIACFVAAAIIAAILASLVIAWSEKKDYDEEHKDLFE
jgi:uncharacterized membrane protein YedE/YeeE